MKQVITPRRNYSLEQYRAEVAALDLRRTDASAMRRLLDEEITLELPPVSGVVRRATLLGGLVATTKEATLPVTAAVLRAVGLVTRPSARGRAR